MDRSIKFYESLGLIFGFKKERTALMLVDESKIKLLDFGYALKNQPWGLRHFALDRVNGIAGS
jgi:hypothetical protein